MKISTALRLLLPLLPAALMAGVPTPASARDYPFCVIGDRWIDQDCRYSTIAQCRAAASGTGGHCAQNPRAMIAPQPMQEPQQRRGRRSQYID